MVKVCRKGPKVGSTIPVNQAGPSMCDIVELMMEGSTDAAEGAGELQWILGNGWLTKMYQ